MTVVTIDRPKSQDKSSSQSSSKPKPKEATAMLRADHQLVSKLFDEYESSRSASKKMQIVAEICTELSVHAQLEEEIFYPAVKEALKDQELVPEATMAHCIVL